MGHPFGEGPRENKREERKLLLQTCIGALYRGREGGSKGREEKKHAEKDAPIATREGDRPAYYEDRCRELRGTERGKVRKNQEEGGIRACCAPREVERE